MASLTITIPLAPPRECFPNTRTAPDPFRPGKRKALHWSEKADVVRGVRQLAYYTAREAPL